MVRENLKILEISGKGLELLASRPMNTFKKPAELRSLKESMENMKGEPWRPGPKLSSNLMGEKSPSRDYSTQVEEVRQ